MAHTLHSILVLNSNRININYTHHSENMVLTNKPHGVETFLRSCLSANQ